MGIEVEDRPFAKSTLQVFRAQLILHGKVREVFESSLRLARESGYLKKRSMKVALDTTNILGRGAVKDTCNLLADGIVKLLWALAAVGKSPAKEWAKAQGYKRYLGSSVKGESAIDWSNKRARTALLAEIVADADRLLELSRQAQGELGEDSEERQRIVAAAELLGQLLLQDVERTDDGVSLRDGVSRDRMMPVHDPEMRHGHKSSSRRFDGHKAAIVVDTDSQLITAVEVLPGNAPDNLGALEGVPSRWSGPGRREPGGVPLPRVCAPGGAVSPVNPRVGRGRVLRRGRPWPMGMVAHLRGGEAPRDGGIAHLRPFSGPLGREM